MPMGHAGGGMPMGRAGGGARWGNPSPTPPRFPGLGRSSRWGGGLGFGAFAPNWSFPTWFDTPLCASPLFPLAPVCSYGDPDSSAYYPAPPANTSPAVNVMVMPAPLPPPVRLISVGPGDLSNTSPSSSAGSYLMSSSEIPQAGIEEYQAPTPSNPTFQRRYPPLIILRTGAFSVNRYWIKNKILYFETISGDSLSAPLSLLVRIVPAR
jgi:hypothetical protein